MNIEGLRAFCLSLPHATEDVKWEKDLTFCVGEKMFAVVGLEPGPAVMSFKCTPEKFAELTERPGVIPAPYLARYNWVALETFDALAEEELKALVRTSYELVFDKLPLSLKKKFEL
ncbi:MAG TPA: MmcQ/YjbR family DNA-binding protein [Aridibacter sp.]|nr:MmcQ/YjbR family DNA-binding protein [Aridibacter sp.]